MQSDLQELECPFAMLHVLPIETTITMLSLPPSPLTAKLQMQASLNHEPQPLSLLTIYKFGWQFLQMISYSKVEIASVELATRNQSHCARWFEERQRR